MTIKQKPVQDEWTRFANAVLPANMPKMQRIEMRRAFFAGAAGLWTLMTRHQADGGLFDPGMSETARDLAHMAAIEAELLAFGKSVREGEA